MNLLVKELKVDKFHIRRLIEPINVTRLVFISHEAGFRKWLIGIQNNFDWFINKNLNKYLHLRFCFSELSSLEGLTS